MATISTRVNEKLMEDIEEFMEEEKLDKSIALRKLIAEALEEWKKEKALDLLEKGRITFTKAAEIAEMNVWDFSNLVKEKKIAWIKDGEKIEKDIVIDADI
jgi:predicted HTH domain antitoxin